MTVRDGLPVFGTMATMTEPDRVALCRSSTLPASRPLAIAHRAGNDLTLARAAHAAGADLIEADVWLHRGRLEVRHAKTMPVLPVLWDRRSIAPGWRSRLLLGELLGGLAAEAGVMLDLKGDDPRLPGAVMRALNATPRGGPVAVCSASWAHVDAFFGYEGVTPVHSIGKAHRIAPLLAHLATHHAHAPAAISIYQRLLDADVLGALKNAQAQVIVWPVNEATRAAELVASGVHGLISDDVELVRRIVAARRP